MHNYTDLPMDYKWIPRADIPAISRRNMAIFAMVMNSLDLPDSLHEFAYAVFEAGNWDKTDEYDEISIMRMAKACTSDAVTQHKLYNRLKQKSPKFFEWQEKKSFTLIERIVLHEHTTHHKTKAKYKFTLYKKIESLFLIPLGTSSAAIKRSVAKALKDLPTVEPVSRRSRRKRPETTAKAAVRGVLETYELTGSIEVTNLYLADATVGQLIVRVEKVG